MGPRKWFQEVRENFREEFNHQVEARLSAKSKSKGQGQSQTQNQTDNNPTQEDHSSRRSQSYQHGETDRENYEVLAAEAQSEVRQARQEADQYRVQANFYLNKYLDESKKRDSDKRRAAHNAQYAYEIGIQNGYTTADQENDKYSDYLKQTFHKTVRTHERFYRETAAQCFVHGYYNGRARSRTSAGVDASADAGTDQGPSERPGRAQSRNKHSKRTTNQGRRERHVSFTHPDQWHGYVEEDDKDDDEENDENDEK